MVCPPGDPEGLADAIAHLRGTPSLGARSPLEVTPASERPRCIDALSRDLVAIVSELH